MTRDERQKNIDRLLMLCVVDECNKAGIDLDEDKLMSLIFVIQKHLEANGIEGFHYDDWMRAYADFLKDGESKGRTKTIICAEEEK